MSVKKDDRNVHGWACVPQGYEDRSGSLGRLCGVVLSWSALSAMLMASALAADWPQAGRTPQHGNFTPDSPRPPFKVKWVADFSPEFVFSAQPVVAAGMVYQTTLNGNLYALDEATGARIWHVPLGRVSWGGAAAGTTEYGGRGLVFAASFEGVVYGLDAATGAERWRCEAGEPISGSPCVAQGTVFIGTRRGTMLALDAQTGALKWKTKLSWHIYSTAAWNAGRVYVVTEDLFLHALEAETGRKLWTSRQMRGLCMREFYPVVHQGKVLVAVTPAIFHPNGSGMGMAPFTYQGASEKLLEETRALNREGKMPGLLLERQAEIIEYYRQNPEYQTLYVFHEEDGAEAFIPVHHYGAGGLQNCWHPPTVCADGLLIGHAAFAGRRLVRYDLSRNRWVDMLMELRGQNNDECDYVAVGGSMLFSKEWFSGNRIMDLETREVPTLPRPPRTPTHWISVSRPTWEVSAPWSRLRLGPGTEHPQADNGVSPPVIAGRTVYFMSHNQSLVAWEGN